MQRKGGVMPYFSERIGKTLPKVKLQVASMDEDLRTGLWNIVHMRVIGYLESLPKRSSKTRDALRTAQLRLEGRQVQIAYCARLFQDFFKWPVDSLDNSTFSATVRRIRDWFTKAEWYKVYDFIEWLAQNHAENVRMGEFTAECDEILAREVSGYRFMHGRNELVPISDQQEKKTIETALEDTETKPLLGCHEHLAKALTLFSRRENPDYANSIKESISAVESICRIITKTTDTLGEAIKKLPFGLHPAFTKGISSLYGFTSDAGGIRHGNAGPPVTFDAADAKFLLVTASSFVHFLLQKALVQGMSF